MRRRTAHSSSLGGLQKESLQLGRVIAYYYKHPNLVLPEDASVIWRYMERWKFQAMLQENSVFFSRADKQTGDNLEGEYPEGMLAELGEDSGMEFPLMMGLPTRSTSGIRIRKSRRG